MFVGKKDEIVALEDNRWLYKELGDDIVTHYEELELDHLSFLLAKDMSYFDSVMDVIN
jgi:hypothetical protein